MRAYEITQLVEGFKEAQAEFATASDPITAQKVIASYRELVNKNQIKDLNQKNIDWWRKQGFDAFSQFVQQASAVPTPTAIKRQKVPGKSINLVDNAD